MVFLTYFCFRPCRLLLPQRGSTLSGSEAPSWPLCPPSSRCGSASRSMMSPAPALSTGSASKQTVSPPTSPKHTATNPNDGLCIHGYTNTLVYAEPKTPLPFPSSLWLWHHAPWWGETLLEAQSVPGGVNVWGTWCSLLCLCRSFQMSVFTILFASMKVYSLVGAAAQKACSIT